MKTVYKDYGITASITDRHDGSAKLVVRDALGRKIHEKVHKSRTAAQAAWRRMRQ